MVVFVSPSARDVRCLRAILECFTGALGLVTNTDKCQASPIRCSAEEMALVRRAFPCRITPFPCKYLGVPLSIYRLHRAEEQTLVDIVAMKIPTWKSGLLMSTGRVLLTKVTLSAIQVHVVIASCLSQWAIGQIDKRRRAFLWTGKDSVSRGKCKLAWKTVCLPTANRGLGMIDLRLFGYALRLRWEYCVLSNLTEDGFTYRPSRS